jgi:hypothetical protein
MFPLSSALGKRGILCYMRAGTHAVMGMVALSMGAVVSALVVVRSGGIGGHG